jgi:hypothetical protein
MEPYDSPTSWTFMVVKCKTLEMVLPKRCYGYYDEIRARLFVLTISTPF